MSEHPNDDGPGGTASGPANLNPNLAPHVRRALTTDDYVAGLRAGDRVLLSRAITLVESTRPQDQQQARAVVARCLPHAGGAMRVGVTGVPGVGKSTFIEALGAHLTGQGRRVAVLAIDPTSERSGGSILGDKTRMAGLAANEHAFVRPSPTGGTLGGVARQTRAAITLCEAAGYDVVLVETVGVGQAETAVRAMVDFFLLLALAGAGDELQGIKRGVMEMADALVITKADGPNRDAARTAQASYSSALKLFPAHPSGWTPPVLTCSALEDVGIDRVWETVERYRRRTQATGYFDCQRKEQAARWMHQAIEHRLRQDFYAHPHVQAGQASLEETVRRGEISAAAAAEKLLDLYRPGSS